MYFAETILCTCSYIVTCWRKLDNCQGWIERGRVKIIRWHFEDESLAENVTNEIWVCRCGLLYCIGEQKCSVPKNVRRQIKRFAGTEAQKRKRNLSPKRAEYMQVHCFGRHFVTRIFWGEIWWVVGSVGFNSYLPGTGATPWSRRRHPRAEASHCTTRGWRSPHPQMAVAWSAQFLVAGTAFALSLSKVTLVCRAWLSSLIATGAGFGTTTPPVLRQPRNGPTFFPNF